MPSIGGSTRSRFLKGRFPPTFVLIGGTGTESFVASTMIGCVAVAAAGDATGTGGGLSKRT